MMAVSRLLKSCDAAGEAPDRLHLLRLAQGDLGGLPPRGLLVQLPVRVRHLARVAHRPHRESEQRQGRRHAEDEMHRHVAHPCGPDRGGIEPRIDVDVLVGQLAVGEDALGLIVGGGGDQEPGVGLADDGAHQRRRER
jgi:hypothetical protein